MAPRMALAGALMVALMASVSAQMHTEFIQLAELIGDAAREQAMSAVPQFPPLRSRKLAQAGGMMNQTETCLAFCKGAAPTLSVCTANGTFPDICVPQCAEPQLNITYFGNCTNPPCLCPLGTFFPVCDGTKTYTSPCFANCSSVTYKDGYCTGDCNCPNTIATVCGRDGKDYQNVCTATCAGVEVWYSGPCDARIGNCSCAPTYNPVCVSNVVSQSGFNVTVNQTYTSPCIAQCDGATNWTVGVCADELQANAKAYLCNCPNTLDPVIVRVPGPLNKTMTALNQCSATCLNQTVIEKGIAKECICPFSGKPVCANNVTYTSACAARCEGNATTWTDGGCPLPGGGTTITDCTKCPPPTGNINDFVCGSNGLPYPSACFATCTGVTVVSQGPCGIPPGVIPGVPPGADTGDDGDI